MNLTSRRALPAILVLACTVLAGCGGPTPSASTPVVPDVVFVDGCANLGADIGRLAWSSGGAFLAVATHDETGEARAWVFAAEGRQTDVALTIPYLSPDTLVVTPEGRRAWLARTSNDQTLRLIEDRVVGVRETQIGVAFGAMAWTSRGFAIVELREDGETRIVMVDPDTDPRPTVWRRGGGGVVWVSGDGERMLVLSSTDGGSYDLVDSNASRVIKGIATDSRASMVGDFIVYHTVGGQMVVIPIDDAKSPSPVSDRLIGLGMISDHGILATAGWNDRGVLCLEDVRAKLR